MKRVPYTFGQDTSGKMQWRSVEEALQPASLQQAESREFLQDDASVLDPVSRRSFLSLAGATAGLAGMVACRRPEEKILPYVRMAEDLVPGNAQYYATAVPWAGSAVGLLVESHEGRPTKVEGNPRHPESLGGSNAYLQAMVLDVYDVDRSRSPAQKKQKSSWDAVAGELKARGEALKAAGGKGLAILTDAHRSPTLQAQLDEVQKAFPAAKIHRFEPLHRDNIRDGVKLAFGKALEPVANVAAANVIVSLEADFLQTDGSTLKNARGFAQSRTAEKAGATMARLYVAESTFTVTGANADHRLRIPSRDVAEYAFALARELSTSHGINLGELAGAVASFNGARFESARKWVKAVAKDLANNKGRALVLAGQNQPPVVHAITALLNNALEGVGKTVTYVKPFVDAPEGPASILALTESLKKKEVDTLLVLGGNPVFTAPSDADFGAALAGVPHTFHLGLFQDETGEACGWHINAAHAFESWSDVRALDGTVSITQPLIAPIFGGKTDAEVLAALLGNPTAKAYGLVQAAWKGQYGLEADKAWRKALHDGLVAQSAFAAEAVEPKPADVAAAVGAHKGGDGVEVTFHPDCHAWDGRFANNGWLQEMPDPMVKLTWDNAAWFSVATAQKLGLTEGDMVTLTLGGKSIKLPCIYAPGQADESVAITLGQGRAAVGRVGVGVGFNTYAVRQSNSPWTVSGAQVAKAGGDKHKLARTQEHHVMEGRPVAREGTKAEFDKDPAFAQKAVKLPQMVNLNPEWEYKGHRWAMAIDLNACIGCNACMVACQAENNIPIVGKFGVSLSREMHWIRVDRYYVTDKPKTPGALTMSHTEMQLNEPTAIFQPIPCMQCEMAPCETVCPVAATTHSPEGLNDMAYNRCIGTRYCANNCPYKVRRFNFHAYDKDFNAIKRADKPAQFVKEGFEELRKMQFNPDVTVRMRGVMEKCTYCVQRINEGKIAAKREARELKDGEIITACQQTCPTGAIHFGDLAMTTADVVKTKQQGRNYALLEELNTRPRTTYLARVRNPNPELDA